MSAPVIKFVVCKLFANENAKVLLRWKMAGWVCWNTNTEMQKQIYDSFLSSSLPCTLHPLFMEAIVGDGERRKTINWQRLDITRSSHRALTFRAGKQNTKLAKRKRKLLHCRARETCLCTGVGARRSWGTFNVCNGGSKKQTLSFIHNS